MNRILDDMRRDAIAKIRGVSQWELENGWRRISNTVVELMVSNELARKEGFLILEDTQIKSGKDEFFKRLLNSVADGAEPELIVEMASNEYWLEEPAELDAMIKYMQIRGVILMLSHISTLEFKKFLLSLIPKTLCFTYEQEISIWESEVRKIAELKLKTFRRELEAGGEKIED